MLAFKKGIQDWTMFVYGKVKGYYSPANNLYLLGIYDGTLFQGTDKLAMTVVTDVLVLMAAKPGANFIFEGDRLFCGKNFDNFMKFGELLIVAVHSDNLIRRLNARGNVQSLIILERRISKIDNIKRKYKVLEYQNDTEEQKNKTVEAFNLFL